MVCEKVYKQNFSNKWVVKWVCECGYVDLDSKGYIKPSGIETYVGRIKECPKCKSFGKQDKINSIKRNIEHLTEERSRMSVEIEKMIRELEELESKIN